MDQANEATSVLDQTSERYFGRWSRLISTTNWEKGQIIHEWRNAMIAAKTQSSEYSDETWSRTVGSVTGQHAGRLRRVFDRFGDFREQFEGLFWSHFQAALDWEDAEMWLEGALQKKWSVAKMRKQRWETLGSPEDLKPREEDVVSAEMDEDFVETDDSGEPVASDSFDRDPRSPAGPDFGDDDGESGSGGAAIAEVAAAQQVAPFENLPDLPEDVAAAFESYKLAILNHKTNEWAEISQKDILSSLDALKQLATAPSA